MKFAPYCTYTVCTVEASTYSPSRVSSVADHRGPRTLAYGRTLQVRWYQRGYSSPESSLNVVWRRKVPLSTAQAEQRRTFRHTSTNACAFLSSILVYAAALSHKDFPDIASSSQRQPPVIVMGRSDPAQISCQLHATRPFAPTREIRR